MGENNLILEEPPKNLQYIRLLLNYSSEDTFWGKAAAFITRNSKTQAHSIAQWCQILGSQNTNPQTRQFLEKLVEKNALIKEPGTKDPEKYRLDKENLTSAVYEDPYYLWHKDLFFRVINTHERFKKVKTDF